MHDDTLSLSPAYRYQVEHRLSGEAHVYFHVHIHFDHAALAAKLREATSDLKAAVDANQPPVPTS